MRRAVREYDETALGRPVSAATLHREECLLRQLRPGCVITITPAEAA